MAKAAQPRYQIIEDKDLVAASLAGRREAYDELVRRYRGAVIVVAFQVLGSRELAQDVAQDAFLTAVQRLNQLKEPARFGPWICTVARNRARQVLRRECRSSPLEGEQMDRLLTIHCHELIANPMEELLHKERDTAIRRLMADLPPSVQVVLELYYREQWDVARIAEFLSLTRTTVKWRLYAGRKRMLGELAELVSGDLKQTCTRSVKGKCTELESNTRKDNRGNGKEQEERGQTAPPHAG